MCFFPPCCFFSFVLALSSSGHVPKCFGSTHSPLHRWQPPFCWYWPTGLNSYHSTAQHSMLAAHLGLNQWENRYISVCHRHDNTQKLTTFSSPGTTHIRPWLIQLDRDEVTTAGIVIQSHNTLQRVGLMRSVAHHHHIQLVLVVHFMDCLTANSSRRISNEVA